MTPAAVLRRTTPFIRCSSRKLVKPCSLLISQNKKGRSGAYPNARDRPVCLEPEPDLYLQIALALEGAGHPEAGILRQRSGGHQVTGRVVWQVGDGRRIRRTIEVHRRRTARDDLLVRRVERVETHLDRSAAAEPEVTRERH